MNSRWLALLLTMTLAVAADPVHDAARQGDLAALKSSADVNARDPGGYTPLMCAVEAEQKKAVVLLLQLGAKVDDVDPQGRTALFLAAQAGRLDTVRLLLNGRANPLVLCADPPRTALCAALESGNRALVNVLVDAGSDLDKPLPGVGAPLHWAAEHATPEVLLALLNPPAEARLDTRDDRGRTPLHRAAAAGRLEAVRMLVTFGSDLAALDSDGATALDLARQANHVSVVALLEHPPKAKPGHRDVRVRM